MICIDLGSNTLRACEMNNSLEILDRHEIIVGSAAGLSEAGLAPEAMERIRSGMSEMKRRFDFSNGYKAVATEAFRLARNASDFFDGIERDFGIRFDIIDPALEASLTRMGIKSRADILGLDISNSISIDLGGASTEVCFGDKSESFSFGIVRFFELCGGETTKFELLAPKQVEKAREFALSFKFESVILTSGVPTTVAALMEGMNYTNYDASRINGFELKFEHFAKAREIIKRSQDADTLVGVGRAGLVLAGIELLGALLKDMKVPFIVIDDGLREGVGVACALGKLNIRRINER